MTAEEIRAEYKNCAIGSADGTVSEDLAHIVFLAEIAAQLAELNENLRSLMTKCDHGFCLDVRDIGRKKD